ncbi:MAG TPA: hypothetical protein VKB88_02880 [Bryobacteraceae bacterium]|nr:hypothetical protein [Bryobacteraceae bacterium]
MLVAAQDGIYKASDDGANWRKTYTGPVAPSPEIVIDPSITELAYALSEFDAIAGERRRRRDMAGSQGAFPQIYESFNGEPTRGVAADGVQFAGVTRAGSLAASTHAAVLRLPLGERPLGAN